MLDSHNTISQENTDKTNRLFNIYLAQINISSADDSPRTVLTKAVKLFNEFDNYVNETILGKSPHLFDRLIEGINKLDYISNSDEELLQIVKIESGDPNYEFHNILSIHRGLHKCYHECYEQVKINPSNYGNIFYEFVIQCKNRNGNGYVETLVGYWR